MGSKRMLLTTLGLLVLVSGALCDQTDKDTPQIELRGGSTPREGNVYALNSRNELGPVCSLHGWIHDELKAARVVCRQLGFVGGWPSKRYAFGSVSSAFAMDEVHCNGSETRIQDCQYRELEHCWNSYGTGVECKESCTSSQFQCTDGERCIERSDLCDVWHQCDDNSDELEENCGNCTTSEFACADGKQCVPAENKCDGWPHCRDWSDDAPSLCGGCALGPNLGYFVFPCADGKKCTPIRYVCDGTFNGNGNCDDGSDEWEENCGNCTESQFACADGRQCIPAQLKCNGDFDCSDYSDEPTSLCGACGDDQFACADGKKCIKERDRCNGFSQCLDHSDEYRSLCGPCDGSWQFACTNGYQCVSTGLDRCNGWSDCDDGSDEDNCG